MIIDVILESFQQFRKELISNTNIKDKGSANVLKEENVEVRLWELIKGSQDSITVNKHGMSTNFNKNSDKNFMGFLFHRVRRKLKLKEISIFSNGKIRRKSEFHLDYQSLPEK